MASLPRPPSRVVDLGSGDGDAVTFLRTLLPAATTIVGADLLEPRLAGSRRRHPELAVMAANGAALPLPDGAVDLVSVFTVFSSILDAGLARAVAAEIDRVVAPDGHVLWYDLRRDNPRNRSVRGISPAEVQALFPGWRVELRSCTVLPPLARRTVPVVAASYRWWSLLPPLRTHLLGLLRRV